MKCRFGFYVLGCLSVMAMLCGCSTPKMLSGVPLVWKPTKDINDADTSLPAAIFAHKYKIMPFIDSRENKREIAKNIEDKKDKLVTTCDNVSDWCRSRFMAVIKQRGFNVVEENASMTFKGEVLEFYVIEDNMYNASVGIKITAENAAGNVVWQGMMSGSAKRFGHSYKLENYYETLSDAYINAVNGLLKNQEFRTALQKK
ncbi:MAG TPA: hypothetical protein DCZ94_02245 [Lentisphaeria bacterium]|nr:MAG: hypothetical protein A2X48_16490 [Lentisphaerae bacterium GWF2_49_21]HBC85754.1 hypothetical protein [Lentisphaeria bacterium]